VRGLIYAGPWGDAAPTPGSVQPVSPIWEMLAPEGSDGPSPTDPACAKLSGRYFLRDENEIQRELLDLTSDLSVAQHVDLLMQTIIDDAPCQERRREEVLLAILDHLGRVDDPADGSDSEMSFSGEGAAGGGPLELGDLTRAPAFADAVVERLWTWPLSDTKLGLQIVAELMSPGDGRGLPCGPLAAECYMRAAEYAGDAELQEEALTALCNVTASAGDDTRKVVIAGGAMPRLAALLRGPACSTPDVREAAVMLAWNLLQDESAEEGQGQDLGAALLGVLVRKRERLITKAACVGALAYVAVPRGGVPQPKVLDEVEALGGYEILLRQAGKVAGIQHDALASLRRYLGARRKEVLDVAAKLKRCVPEDVLQALRDE
jgi:hypothetical protein